MSDEEMVRLSELEHEQMRAVEAAARRILRLIDTEALSFEDPAATTLGAIAALRSALRTLDEP